MKVGKDYSHYSDSDLKRRVWELERAVFQLQQKVFEIQMGESFSAVGNSKAIAENAIMGKCKASPRTANGFHCGEANCFQ